MPAIPLPKRPAPSTAISSAGSSKPKPSLMMTWSNAAPSPLPFFAGSGDGAAFDQVIISDGFGFDEPALEIAVDGAGRFGSGIAGMDGPGADLFLAGGQKGPQAKQM